MGISFKNNRNKTVHFSYAGGLDLVCFFYSLSHDGLGVEDIKHKFKQENFIINLKNINTQQDPYSAVYKIGTEGIETPINAEELEDGKEIEFKIIYPDISLEDLVIIDQSIEKNKNMIEDKASFIYGYPLEHNIMLNSFIDLIKDSIKNNSSISYSL